MCVVHSSLFEQTKQHSGQMNTMATEKLHFKENLADNLAKFLAKFYSA